MTAAAELVIAWTPQWSGKAKTRGQVSLLPRPPMQAVDDFAMWTYAVGHGQAGGDALAQIFINFHTLIVRDGIDQSVAHAVFLGIDEYRAAIAPDIEGAARL